MTGPEVERKLTPSSRATICASVVLPRPGGPDEQHVVERFAAGLRQLDEDRRFLRAASWPVKSASTWGLSAASSSGRFSAEKGGGGFSHKPKSFWDPFPLREKVAARSAAG